MSDYEPEYWRDLYRKAAAARTPLLKAVCLPGLPLLANRLLDQSHARAFRHLMSGLSSPPREQAVDVGCGGGRWSRRLRALGYQVTGAEYAVEALAENQRNPANGNIAWTAAKAQSLPFRDNTFNLVNVVTVIQHLDYDSQELALDEIIRVLKPGGRLVMMECITSRGQPGKSVRWEGVYPRSEGEWGELLRSRGMTVEKRTRFQYFPVFTWYWNLRTRFGWLRRADRFLVNPVFLLSLPFDWNRGTQRGSHCGWLAIKANS